MLHSVQILTAILVNMLDGDGIWKLKKFFYFIKPS